MPSANQQGARLACRPHTTPGDPNRVLTSAKHRNAATGATARASIAALPTNLGDSERSYAIPKLDQRISELELKLKQLKSKQQRIDARARALANRRARQDDTRRKILIGATVLARVDGDELDHADLQAWLDAHLTRDDDRALFDLPAMETDRPENKAD